VFCQNFDQKIIEENMANTFLKVKKIGQIMPSFVFPVFNYKYLSYFCWL